ncbi:hypothetical protein DFH09DRAFT_1479697 [Mycena vulgaris]|nr:hypothetical protein DFH09DRAFT_1479697 [Mycena vulgaris]
MSKSFSSPFHRDHLIRTKQYAASPMFPASFTFAKMGRGHKLTEVIPGPIDPDGPAPPDGIIIVIGTVSDTNLWLSPLGNYNPTSTFKKPIQEAKYVFMIDKPKTDPTFEPDYPVAMAALDKVQTSISRTGINKWFIVNDESERVFRFATPVFEKKDGTTEPTTDITTWPVPIEHRENLEGIKKDYIIREFVVFDIDHSRIDPLDIARKLKGALVETSFKLIHYCFGGDDSFVAEIEQVVILRYAAVQLPSPYKKALSKPYRPAAMSPEEVHAQQQLAVKHFSLPYSAAGPSNLPAPTQKDVNKRKASSEPEGSDAKRAKDGENEDEGNSGALVV